MSGKDHLWWGGFWAIGARWIGQKAVQFFQANFSSSFSKFSLISNVIPGSYVFSSLVNKRHQRCIP